MIGVGINTSSVGGKPKPLIPGALLVADFVDGALPGSTFTRASDAWNFAPDGITLAPVADSNILRRDLRGALVEALVLAHGCNSSLLSFGAGSPGTMPTNWSVRSAPTGLTRTLTAVTIGGVQYVEMNFAGTTSGSGSFQLQFGGSEGAGTALAVASGGTLNTSIIAQVVQDDPAVAGIGLYSWCFTAGNSYVSADSSGSTNLYANRATLKRYNLQKTLVDGTTTKAVGLVTTNSIASGTAVNWTILLGLPQMTKTTAVTSPILTGTSAVTRAADNLTFAVSGIAAGADWTVAGVLKMPDTPDNSSEAAFGFEVDGSNRWVIRRNAGSFLGMLATVANATTGSIFTAAPALGARFAFAARRSGSTMSMSINGGAVATTTPSSMSAGVPSLLTFGQTSIGGGQWNSCVERGLLFSGAANDAELQARSTLATWGG